MRGSVYDAVNQYFPDATGCRLLCSASWNARNFQGFWYDLKDNLFSETLQINSEPLTASDRTIDAGHLWYNTSRLMVPYKVYENGWGTVDHGLDSNGSNVPGGGYYAVAGWQGTKYVAVNGKVNKLSRLLIEQGNASSEKKTLAAGETWDMGEGYALTVNSIDAEAIPRRARFTLSLNGINLDNRMVAQGDKYTYNASLGGENNVPVFVS